MTGPTRQHGSFDAIMQAGGKVESIHTHEKNSNLTAIIQSKDGEELTFTNLTREHLDKYTDVGKEVDGGDYEGDGSDGLDDAMKAGGRISEYHKHDQSMKYVCHVVIAKNDTQVFSNIDKKQLAKYCKVDSSVKCNKNPISLSEE